MRVTRRVSLAVVTIMVALVGSPGCARTEAAPAASAAQPSFGGTDRAWIEINIAMDEHLLPLLALAPGHGRDTGVRALAQQVEAFTDAELGTLRALRDQAGLPSTNPHEGMTMPGLVSPAQLTEAAKLTGTAFDTLAAKHLEDFLEQGRSLASSEQQAGMQEQARALAQEMVAARTRALSAVRK